MCECWCLPVYHLPHPSVCFFSFCTGLRRQVSSSLVWHLPKVEGPSSSWCHSAGLRGSRSAESSSVSQGGQGALSEGKGTNINIWLPACPPIHPSIHPCHNLPNKNIYCSWNTLQMCSFIDSEIVTLLAQVKLEHDQQQSKYCQIQTPGDNWLFRLYQQKMLHYNTFANKADLWCPTSNFLCERMSTGP